MNIPESILSTLTEEQKAKIQAARSPEELLAIAKDSGYELSGEQLENISGGINWSCPRDCKKNKCLDLCRQF